ncbi:SPRY domain-containing SOCS box protein 3-like [Patiria miniata]|uniref:B30.2/SPRY domain-containing protein n=1 Tax=Patiria miniata TaxID=46514 RepID=A0A914A1D0_PATMI|nr:SPRY domain-containing SOCS box protein 3-like [Patiria miniata]
MATTSPLLHEGCEDFWSWSQADKSHEVKLQGARNETAVFHPNWSNGTAGVRGTRVLNRGRFYWELRLSRRVFGTSMMFGIGTKRTRLHIDEFINMLGENEQSWGLSHKGLLWHGGTSTPFTDPFPEKQPTTVGLLFDGIKGTLTFYKDGVCLGEAFTGLNRYTCELYPFVCSTAAKTEMTLVNMRRRMVSLEDRCCVTIATHLRSESEAGGLLLPAILRNNIVRECSRQSHGSDPMAPLKAPCGVT